MKAARAMEPTPFTKMLIGALDPTSLEEGEKWCKGPERRGSHLEFTEKDWRKLISIGLVNSSLDYKEQMNHLVQKGLFRKVEYSKGRKALIRYFQVDKAETDKKRAITSCRLLNEIFGKPGSFPLMSAKSIRAKLEEYAQPCVSVQDFKNFFYQIGMHEWASFYFTVKMGEERFEIQAWPMGFSWSPVVAQGVTTILLLETRRRVALELGIKTEQSFPVETSPEFVDLVRDPRKEAKKREQQLVLSMGAVYDNVLVITENPTVRRLAMQKMCEIQKEWNWWTKGNDEQIAPIFDKDKPIDAKGWDCMGEEVGSFIKFLGLDYSVKSRDGRRRIQFRHCDKNVTRWEKIRAKIGAKKALSYRDVAKNHWHPQLGHLHLGQAE